MANPVKGAVSFEAAGKSYTLSYSINALCELEEMLGEGVTEVAAKMGGKGGTRLSLIRALFWAGLRDHHPEVTIVESGELMREYGIQETSEIVGRAFMLAFPQADGRRSAGGRESGPLGGKRRPGTGRSSSRAG